jgi:hypothetical protein
MLLDNGALFTVAFAGTRYEELWAGNEGTRFRFSGVPSLIRRGASGCESNGNTWEIHNCSEEAVSSGQDDVGKMSLT